MAADEKRALAEVYVERFITCESSEHSDTQENMEKLVRQYYTELAALVRVSEDALMQADFEETIKTFKAKQMSNEERNRILGEILAADILRAPVTTPNKFLYGDAWLSKQLIAALIGPQDPNFKADVIDIFKAALCNLKVIEKYNRLLCVDSASIRRMPPPIVRWLNVRLYLGRIFSGSNPSSLHQDESQDSSKADDYPSIASAVVAHIDAKIAEAAPTDPSSTTADFLLGMCCSTANAQNAFSVGGLVFLMGFTLALSTVVTALPSFGLSVVPSLGIGCAAMVVGGGIMMAALGFFSSPGSPSSSTSTQQNYDHSSLMTL